MTWWTEGTYSQRELPELVRRNARDLSGAGTSSRMISHCDNMENEGRRISVQVVTHS